MSLMQKWLLGVAASLAVATLSGIAVGGWKVKTYIVEELATKDEVIVAGTQAQFSLGIQLDQMKARLERLKAKRNKTREDYERIKWLREDIQRTEQMLRGKR